jgi:hypothetical protein
LHGDGKAFSQKSSFCEGILKFTFQKSTSGNISKGIQELLVSNFWMESNSRLSLQPLIQKDGGIGPCDVLATGGIIRKVLLSTTHGRG